MYILKDFITTKKGNHLFSINPKEQWVFDKNGGNINPIYKDKEHTLAILKPGSFVFEKDEESSCINLYQLVKIVRDIEEGYEDYAIQNIPASAINYQGVFYHLNSYSLEHKEWQNTSWINRLTYVWEVIKNDLYS